MDEISKAVAIAFLGLISALATQILLRLEQASRDTKVRLLNDLRSEQSHSERIAYRARQLVLGGDVEEKREGQCSHIDGVLFGEVYRGSNLVTFCAELEFFEVPTASEYSESVHRFRGTCRKIVMVSSDKKTSNTEQEDIERIIIEIKTISELTTALTKEIHFRFSWKKTLGQKIKNLRRKIREALF